MGHKMDKQEYAKCIEDDIDFLKRNLPESLFKCLWTSHIIEVLKASINMIYDRPSLTSDLDKAKLAFSEERFPDEKMAPLRRAARIGYEAGAEWMAGQGAIKYWMAKDKDGHLLISDFEPFKRYTGYLDTDSFKWINISPTLSRELFPDIKLEDNPVKVIVQIRKKK